MLTAWRSLIKNRTYALINLTGLTLGVSVSILISLFVMDEMSYDRSYGDSARVIRITPAIEDGSTNSQWATSEGFLIPMIAGQYPEIQSATRIIRNDNEIVFRSATEEYAQDGVIAADSTFFEVFPFHFISGDPKTALRGVHNIVITDDVAHKFFGSDDPLGKILTTDFGTQIVSGVIENVTPATHFHFKVLFPLRGWWREADQSRNAYAFYSYIRLAPSTTPAEFESKALKGWYNKFGYVNEQGETVAPSGPTINLLAVPVRDIHLQSHAEKEFEPNGQLQVVYIFIAVGILLIVVATINYVNLSNAIAIRRAKEVAIRKTIGASQRKLFFGFIVESYLFTLAAFVLAIVIVFLAIPQFNAFTGKFLSSAALADDVLIVMIGGSWLTLGFLAGFYPATILSSFHPVDALKSGSVSRASGGFAKYLRQGLIVSQFTISAFLVVGALTIRQQLNFIDSRDTGFSKNNAVVLPLAGAARRTSHTIKEELNRVRGVQSCAATSAVPGKRVVILLVRVPDLAGTTAAANGTDDGSRSMRVLCGDFDIVKTLGLKMVDGRDFSVLNPADTADAFILNEAAVKEFNLKDPVGRPFEYTYAPYAKKGKVVGVVGDFNFASVHSAVEPIMIHIMPAFYTSLCVRLTGEDVPGTLTRLEERWHKVTDYPFSYQFLDSSYDAMYRTERSTARVVTWFTGLALTIAGLGLFGIVSFFVAQRTREVGIRKVFGASQRSLIDVLSREYIVMVVVGNLAAVLPAYWLVSRWLQQFAYHIDVSFISFVLALIVSELLAFVSIIYVIMRTAKASPAVILRHE